IENLHERDSVACALKAYHNYENKFRQIDALAKERGIVGKEDRVKRLVLEGVSVQKAILDLKAGEGAIEQPVGHIRPKEPEPDTEVLRKNEKIRELLSSNEELRKALMRLESDKKTLQEKLLELERGIYERVMRDREMRKRDARIRVLAAKQPHKQKRKPEKGQSDLKALADKKLEENDEKKVDIDSIIMRYRQKSLDR
ncbi:MAG: hypothetical protein V1909_01250, partial [Candidatus Micrarchaeota archaeon]